MELYLHSPRCRHGVDRENFDFTFTFTPRNLELTLQLELCKNLQKKCVLTQCLKYTLPLRVLPSGGIP